MEIFELVNGQPVITKEALLIPHFSKLQNRDKTKDKSIAFKEFSYLYFACNYKSLYLAYPKEEREIRLAEDFIGDKKWKPDKDLISAMIKYNEFQNTPTMRFLQANLDAMESLTKYYSDIDWDELDISGKKLKYDITKVSGSVKQAGGIIDNIEKLKAKVAKEQNTLNAAQRGGGTGGILEFED